MYTHIGKAKPGEISLSVLLTLADGSIKDQELISGEIIRLEAPYEPMKAILKPSKNMNIGGGKGQEIQANIFGGTVGLIFDGRDRPITIPANKEKRLESIRSWSDALNEYPPS